MTTKTRTVTVTATETIRNARGGVERFQAAQVFDDGESVATFVRGLEHVLARHARSAGGAT